jgi:hypothetical protein
MTTAVAFYLVEAFGPGRIGLWTLCPFCLTDWEHRRRIRLRVAAELPAAEDEPRRCSACARPQLSRWSSLERRVAEWDAGVRQALAEDCPF